jgi:hypothetical protein
VLFEFDDMQPAGSGVLEPIVRIQAKGTEEGYNTSNRAFPFDEVPPAGTFTRDLRFGELAATDGLYQFVLDSAEPRGGSKSLLSLDALQIYISDTGSQNTAILGDLGTLIYDLDAGEDSTVLMDAAAASAPGNGVSDVLVSIPTSIFAGVSPDDFVILYSRFGDTDSSEGGFEEWSVVIPEARLDIAAGEGSGVMHDEGLTP